MNYHLFVIKLILMWELINLQINIRVNILQPGWSWGHCIAVDPYFITQSFH